jgi:hypothetical protein
MPEPAIIDIIDYYYQQELILKIGKIQKTPMCARSTIVQSHVGMYDEWNIYDDTFATIPWTAVLEKISVGARTTMRNTWKKPNFDGVITVALPPRALMNVLTYGILEIPKWYTPPLRRLVMDQMMGVGATGRVDDATQSCDLMSYVVIVIFGRMKSSQQQRFIFFGLQAFVCLAFLDFISERIAENARRPRPRLSQGSLCKDNNNKNTTITRNGNATTAADASPVAKAGFFCGQLLCTSAPHCRRTGTLHAM